MDLIQGFDPDYLEINFFRPLLRPESYDPLQMEGWVSRDW